MICLISCVSKKLGHPATASELYISQLFRKSKQYAQSMGYTWYVLSAEYGLVSPGQWIEPYEKTLNKMRVSQRREWSKQVMVQLMEIQPGIRHVVFLAGVRYREFLIHPLKRRSIEISIPMEGLRIGKQLSWLDKNKH